MKTARSGPAVAFIGCFFAATFFVACGAAVRAQTAQELAAGGKMAFDVASIKRTDQPSYQDRANVPLSLQGHFTPTGGLFSTTGGKLLAYIGFAYKLNDAQRGELANQFPEWAVANSYAIEARAAGNPSLDQYRLMMQALLADRFKLAVHFETRPTPVLALELAKEGKLGPKLRQHPASDDCADDAQLAGLAPTVSGGFPQACGGFHQVPASAQGHYTGGARNVPMETISESLAQFTGTGKQVVDATRLSGNYDFLIDFTLMSNGAPLDPNAPTFLEALRDELGLKLVEQTAPMQTLVVDHVEEPAAN
jgi:uncharacterized protein (TIGR03435 family)